MPLVSGLVFELPGVLGGGVSGSPVRDGHGKCLSYRLLGETVCRRVLQVSSLKRSVSRTWPETMTVSPAAITVSAVA